MLDGFAPGAEEFFDLPWGDIRKDNGVNFNEWLQDVHRNMKRYRQDGRETAYLTAYRNAIKSLLRGSCPHANERRERFLGRGELPPFNCSYTGLSTGDTIGSIEVKYGSGYFPREVLDGELPKLQAEYRHDEQQGKRHYLQNVMIYPQDGGSCANSGDTCARKWADTLHFRVKEPGEYLDAEGFSGSWNALLNDMTVVMPRGRIWTLNQGSYNTLRAELA